MLRSTQAHARIASIEVSEARALPGVELVWTGADVAGFGRASRGGWSWRG